MELILKSELISFVDEYNRVCERDFECEVTDDEFRIITEGFITATFLNMYMERFRDKGLTFVVVYNGEKLVMLIH